MSRCDICVFGATGFTGAKVVEYLVEYKARKDLSLTCAVAGRSRSKLAAVLGSVAERTGLEDVKSMEVLLADVMDHKSLEAMCRRSRIVVNCVGPYRFYGESVVKACVSNGTHYLDISGEPQFLESMEAKYNEMARTAGVTVVSACGFDSIPADIGTAFTIREFERDGAVCAAVESFLTMNIDDSGGKISGACGHFTTYECAVHGFGDQDSLRKLRKAQNHPRIPRVGSARPPKRANGGYVGGVIQQYALPFMGSDASVVRRSQRARLSRDQHGVSYNAYFTIASRFGVFLFIVFGFIFQLLARFEYGRRLLLRYPRFFTNGFFSHEGPSDEMLSATSFTMQLLAYGYAKDDSDRSQYTKRMLCSVHGPEPGYVATPIFLIQAALQLLEGEEQAKSPDGGVYTTATAFADTLPQFIDRLQQEGIQFTASKLD